MFHSYASRLHAARAVRRAFEDAVPGKILEPFVQAILAADQPVVMPDEDEDDDDADDEFILSARERTRRAVYGPAPWDGGEMIVLPLGTALDHAAYYLARSSARTYGEFFATLPAHWREVSRGWADQYSELDGFEEYWRRRLLGDDEEFGIDEPGTEVTRERAWAEYRTLSPVDGRPPLDDDPFNATAWEAWEFEYDLAPEHPQTVMTETVPTSILRQHGSVCASMWDGDMASMRMKDERAIAAAYHRLGYTLLRDDLLIAAACSFTPGPDGLMARLLADQEYDQEFGELADGLDASFDDGNDDGDAEAVIGDDDRDADRTPAPAPLPALITEITADPWLHGPQSSGPVPPDARLVCTYHNCVEMWDLDETLHLRRTPAADELWISNELHSGRAVVAPPYPDPAAAARALFAVLVKSRVGFAWPQGFGEPGLLDEGAFTEIVAGIDAELARNAEAAVDNETGIVRTARELGLHPEPTGEGPSHWRARCPGTQHTLLIGAASDQFGCGYCKVKGGPDELKEFVARRESDGRPQAPA